MKLIGSDRAQANDKLNKSIEALNEAIRTIDASAYITTVGGDSHNGLPAIHDIFSEALEFLYEARHKLWEIENYL